MTTILLALHLSLGAFAQTSESVAVTCNRAKVREAYKEGWSVRTSTKAQLGQGQREVYQLTMQAGNSYKVLACGDHEFKNVDIVVYDENANVVGSEPGVDREPMVEVKPSTSGTFYVVVFANGMNNNEAKGTVATAVIYK